jgi:hypothetical protein
MQKACQIKKHTLKTITDSRNGNNAKNTKNKNIKNQNKSNPRGVELSCWICGIVGNL